MEPDDARDFSGNDRWMDLDRLCDERGVCVKDGVRDSHEEPAISYCWQEG